MPIPEQVEQSVPDIDYAKSFQSFVHGLTETQQVTVAQMILAALSESALESVLKLYIDEEKLQSDILSTAFYFTANQEQTIFYCKALDLSIDFIIGRIYIANELINITLSPTTAAVLLCLIRNCNQVVSRRDIYAFIYRPVNNTDVSYTSGLIDTYIHRVRAKLDQIVTEIKKRPHSGGQLWMPCIKTIWARDTIQGSEARQERGYQLTFVPLPEYYQQHNISPQNPQRIK